MKTKCRLRIGIWWLRQISLRSYGNHRKCSQQVLRKSTLVLLSMVGQCELARLMFTRRLARECLQGRVSIPPRHNQLGQKWLRLWVELATFLPLITKVLLPMLISGQKAVLLTRKISSPRNIRACSFLEQKFLATVGNTELFYLVQSEPAGFDERKQERRLSLLSWPRNKLR